MNEIITYVFIIGTGMCDLCIIIIRNRTGTSDRHLEATAIFSVTTMRRHHTDPLPNLSQ